MTIQSIREQHGLEETHRFLYFGDARQATWLELFFDLVFVAVIGVIIHDLAYTHNGHISVDQLLRFSLVFIPVWWVWATHTMFADRYDSNSTVQKFFTLSLMSLVILMTPFIEDSLGDEFHYFLAPYLAMRVLLASAYMLVSRNSFANSGPAKHDANAILIGLTISSVALFIDSNIKYVFLYGGILVDMAIQAIPIQKSRDYPIHKKHLAERIGLFSIILLSPLGRVKTPSFSWQLLA